MPTYPLGSPVNWDNLLTNTLAHYRPKMLHTIVVKSPFLAWLTKANRKGGKPVNLIKGGEAIYQDLMYSLESLQWYGGDDILGTTTTEGFTKARYEWRNAAVPIKLNGEDIRKNSGPEGVRNLTKQLVLRAERSLKKNMNVDLLADNSASAKKVFGIKELIKITPATDGTRKIGDIAAATYSWWRNQDSGDFNAKASAGYPAFLNKIDKVFYDCEFDNNAPDGVMGTLGFYLSVAAAYRAANTAVLQNPKLGELGFENMNIHSADLFYDKDLKDVGATATDEGCYFLNSEFLEFYGHKDAYFNHTTFEKPYNQDVIVAHIIFMGAIAAGNRAGLGVMHGITVE